MIEKAAESLNNTITLCSGWVTRAHTHTHTHIHTHIYTHTHTHTHTHKYICLIEGIHDLQWHLHVVTHSTDMAFLHRLYIPFIKSFACLYNTTQISHCVVFFPRPLTPIAKQLYGKKSNWCGHKLRPDSTHPLCLEICLGRTLCNHK